jgi:hypothetical protein
MSALQDRLSSIGDTLEEVAHDLEGVTETLSALRVAAAHERATLTPGTLDLVRVAVVEAIDEIKQLADIAHKPEEMPA